MDRAAYETTTASLLKGILSDVQTLIREEIALARLEIGQQATRARAAAMSFGMAAGMLTFGVTFLLVALALGVADVFEWPTWAGFGAVAALLIVGGAAAYLAGRSRLHDVHVMPAETISTLKENSAWIAKRLSSEPR